MATFEEASHILRRHFNKGERTPCAVLLRGPWGSGKTFLWSSIAPELPDAVTISLFGITSVDELHEKVFSTLVFKANREPNGGHRYRKWLRGLRKKVSGYCSLAKQKVSGIGLFGISLSINASRLSTLSIESADVCFDDMERSSKEVVEAVLGLTSFLVEQRKCRVLVIFGDELSEQEDAGGGMVALIHRYQEKVFHDWLQLTAQQSGIFERLLAAEVERESDGPYRSTLEDSRPHLIEVWRASGSENIRSIHRFFKKLKELTLAHNRNLGALLTCQLLLSMLELGRMGFSRIEALRFNPMVVYMRVEEARKQGKLQEDSMLMEQDSIVKRYFGILGHAVSPNPALLDFLDSGVATSPSVRSMVIPDPDRTNAVVQAVQVYESPNFSGLDDHDRRTSEGAAIEYLKDGGTVPTKTLVSFCLLLGHNSEILREEISEVYREVIHAAFLDNAARDAEPHRPMIRENMAALERYGWKESYEAYLEAFRGHSLERRRQAVVAAVKAGREGLTERIVEIEGGFDLLCSDEILNDLDSLCPSWPDRLQVYRLLIGSTNRFPERFEDGRDQALERIVASLVRRIHTKRLSKSELYYLTAYLSELKPMPDGGPR